MEDEEPDLLRGSCPAGVSLRWAAEVSSSVYSAPLIADVYGEGTKQVVVPTFVHYLESLEARTRSRAAHATPAPLGLLCPLAAAADTHTFALTA